MLSVLLRKGGHQPAKGRRKDLHYFQQQCGKLKYRRRCLKHLIIGTAGHVDHGKSALIKALTGIDTDRLQEEKAWYFHRSGFAPFSLPGGRLAGGGCADMSGSFTICWPGRRYGSGLAGSGCYRRGDAPPRSNADFGIAHSRGLW